MVDVKLSQKSDFFSEDRGGGVELWLQVNPKDLSLTVPRVLMPSCLPP